MDTLSFMPHRIIALLFAFMLSCYGLAAFALGSGASAVPFGSPCVVVAMELAGNAPSADAASTLPEGASQDSVDAEALADPLEQDTTVDPVDPVELLNVWPPVVVLPASLAWARLDVAAALLQPFIDGPMRPPRLPAA